MLTRERDYPAAEASLTTKEGEAELAKLDYLASCRAIRGKSQA